MKAVTAGLLLILFAGTSVAADRIPGNAVVLQGLDKVTARISTINIRVGETVDFGTLKITLRACEKTPPEDPPEATAFLDILEQRDDEDPTSLFHGWMFASTPALSALEHPVYDVWVLDCIVDPPAATE
ncbi:MAG: DUF2155 domain-containing protein [Alphaproteobacteria bacterium]